LGEQNPLLEKRNEKESSKNKKKRKREREKKKIEETGQIAFFIPNQQIVWFAVFFPLFFFFVCVGCGVCTVAPSVERSRH